MRYSNDWFSPFPVRRRRSCSTFAERKNRGGKRGGERSNLRFLLLFPHHSSCAVDFPPPFFSFSHFL